jgi:hypothetical protein
MRITLTCLLLVFSLSIQAQQITITGKVVDQITKQSLPFASVSISGKAIGVVSNEQGEFDFHIPTELRNDILTVSMIGYKTVEAPVWSLLTTRSDSVIIEMQTSTTLLQEVVVTAKLKAEDVFRIAISRIEQNYPMKPFLLYGFYRDVKKLGGTYISLLEAAVKIYDDNYIEPRNKFKLRERVALQEVRRSLGYSSKFTDFFDQGNLLEDLLTNNNVRYRLFPEEDEFYSSLEFEPNTQYHNREVFVITQRKDVMLKIYIDKETYGIIHIEYENNRQQALNKKHNLESRFTKLKRTIDFREVDGKLFLNYLKVTSQVNWYDRETGKLKFEAELERQLLINNINTSPISRIGLSQKMKGYGLQYQDGTYNKKFWDNYNVIKLTPLDKKIISDLEREEPLEKQFKE